MAQLKGLPHQTAVEEEPGLWYYGKAQHGMAGYYANAETGICGGKEQHLVSAE